VSTTSTERAAFYDGIAGEFRQHYDRGPRLIAVTGVAEADPAAAADELEAALRERGDDVERAAVEPGGDADDFRERIVVPFRSRGGVLIVTGPDLLSPAFRAFWNFSLWIEHDPERSHDWSFVTTGRKDPLGAPREVASVLLDDADPARPRRLFADSC
jgi:hypothetical protein